MVNFLQVAKTINIFVMLVNNCFRTKEILSVETL